MNHYYSYQKPQFKDGTIPPIVIKLGKKKKKQIKKLKKGKGKLTDKIYRNISAIRMRLSSEELNKKTLIPFVLLVKEKQRKKKRRRYGRLSRMIADSGMSPVETLMKVSGLTPNPSASTAPMTGIPPSSPVPTVPTPSAQG